MRLSRALFSRDYGPLCDALCAPERLLVIQDLDGVCMGLVRDPLTRRLERRYIEACRRLQGRFFVLTNGEHIGMRGVNGIVEASMGGPRRALDSRFYLPGLAGGGVQLQEANGRVSHPGVTEAELAFLASVPERAAAMLVQHLRAGPVDLSAGAAVALAKTCVLDNAVSPTLNLNPLHERFASMPEAYLACQDLAAAFLEGELDRARSAGLDGSFFIHYAPNLGRDAHGRERMKPARGDDAGTTDFQFMLRGAVKEAGVLVLLNHYFYAHHGNYPLGPGFNVREAPQDPAALLDLARTHFPTELMPRILGIGDTVTSHGAGEDAQRGGSDRGFLQLVQDLGASFGTDNATVFVDSSAGEVRRPGLKGEVYDSDGAVRWEALEGITDPQDPLRLNFIFPGGHGEYVDFFCHAAGIRADNSPAGPTTP